MNRRSEELFFIYLSHWS